MKWKLFLFVLSLATLNCRGPKENKRDPEKIEVNKIWDKAPYNAFTDLIRFNGKFYCTFREGSGHVPGQEGTNGKIRVITSKNGKNWESVALLEKEGIDLRDPKISITPENRLMIIAGGSIYKEDSLLGRRPQVIFSDSKGSNFSPPEEISLGSKIINYEAKWKGWKGDWIWRVTWHNGIGYGIDYQIGPKERHGPNKLLLVNTKNGKNYNLVHEFQIDGFPNESTIRFDKTGKIYVLIRRELDDKMGVLAVSSPPFSNWEFHDLSLRLGGPNFIFLNNEQLILGSRLYTKRNDTSIYRTGIMLTDLEGKIDTTIVLPSGNDTSYPGLYLYQDTLWVTYYSNQFYSNDFNGRASIYLSKIPLSIFRGESNK